MNDTRNMRRERFAPVTYALLTAGLLMTMALCVSVGSVPISLSDTVTAVWNALWGLPIPQNIAKNIILNVRLPRVLCVALSGASLSLCGAAMQGLLRNPLADGSTIGVSSGAALGAVIAMAAGFTLPGTNYGGVMVTAMAFAFASLALILSLVAVLKRKEQVQSFVIFTTHIMVEFVLSKLQKVNQSFLSQL